MTVSRVAAAVILVILVVGFAVIRQHPTVAVSGSVVRVIDGDTIDVAGPGRVRILLIDTPETYDNSQGKKGCYAFAAKDFVARILPPGTPVNLVTDQARRDKYGRLLAYVETGGVDVGRQVIANGLAVVAYYKPNRARLDDYLKVQAGARDRQLGLWGPVCRP